MNIRREGHIPTDIPNSHDGSNDFSGEWSLRIYFLAHTKGICAILPPEVSSQGFNLSCRDIQEHGVHLEIKETTGTRYVQYGH